ncbi:MAG: triacylglycerol lipase [Glaciecola sp.]|jgi:pimeloyl-ACP methyl ester carboxylesterase
MPSNRFVLKVRIKKPINKDWLKLVMLCFMCMTFLIGCQMHKSNLSQFDSSIDLSNDRDQIILLHGMYRSAVAMQPLETFFRNQGYQVTNISYPSTKYDIQTLVRDYLHPAVEKARRKGMQKIHFVTHSMGGILVRYYLKNHPLESLGKVVMIGPPNQGTELAELFADSSWIDTNTGPAKLQLSAQQDSWVNQLGPVNFVVGIIAGNYNSNLLTAWLLPGEDDGVVSVESTKVQNMKDFMIVNEKHFKLRGNITVLHQAAYFLKHSSFYRSALDFGT